MAFENTFPTASKVCARAELSLMNIPSSTSLDFRAGFSVGVQGGPRTKRKKKQEKEKQDEKKGSNKNRNKDED